MSRELLNNELAKYKQQLWNNEISEETLMQNIRAVCFTEPLVPADQFLSLVREYDPNFAPIPEGPERQRRDEMTQRAQEGVLKQVLHERDLSTAGLVFPEGKTLNRYHYILLRDGTLQQKQEMADLLLGGDKKAVGEYIYNRLGAKKERLFSLLEMNDEQLLENFFEHADDITLISELLVVQGDCEFTPEQARDIKELSDNMARFALLGPRVDLIASPYYAKYPIEALKVPEDKTLEFESMLANLAMAAGETVDNTGKHESLRGPTHMLGYDYYGLRTFMAGATMKQIENYLAPFGKKYGEVLWADYAGDLMNKEWSTTSLLEEKLVFVSIPGVGAKALCNTAANPLDFKLEEAPDKVLNQYMQNISQKAVNRVVEANPIFMSIFSGSKQYNTMEKCMKEAQKAQENLKYPLDRESEEVRKAIEAITKLEAAHKAYMERKEGQGLARDGKDRLIGRTENEVKRLAAADKAKDMYKTLKFQLEYQLSPNSTHGRMEQADRDLKAKRQAEDQRLKNEAYRQSNTTKDVIAPLTEEEKSKSTKQELLDKSTYATMPLCKGSNAGEALGQLQKEVVGSVSMLAARAGANKEMSTGVQNDMRVHMAKVVLFDYVLRERAANNATAAENIVAGPLEKALNADKGAVPAAIGKLANSEAFKEAIGKVTPARLETFLTSKEARTNKFDKIVLESLQKPDPKTANTKAQQQPQKNVQAPAKTAPTPKVNNGLK